MPITVKIQSLADLRPRHDIEITALLQRALLDTEGNVSRAAVLLEIPYSTLARMIGERGLVDATARREGRPKSPSTE